MGPTKAVESFTKQRDLGEGDGESYTYCVILIWGEGTGKGWSTTTLNFASRTAADEYHSPTAIARQDWPSEFGRRVLLDGARRGGEEEVQPLINKPILSNITKTLAPPPSHQVLSPLLQTCCCAEDRDGMAKEVAVQTAICRTPLLVGLNGFA